MILYSRIVFDFLIYILYSKEIRKIRHRNFFTRFHRYRKTLIRKKKCIEIERYKSLANTSISDKKVSSMQFKLNRISI